MNHLTPTRIWNEWLAKHFPHDPLPASFSVDVWLRDLATVLRHNKDPNRSGQLELTDKAGKDDEIFYQEDTGAIESTVAELVKAWHEQPRSSSFGVGPAAPMWPKTTGDIDYRSYKDAAGKSFVVLTPIKDQKNCGCCFIFSVLAQLEAYIALVTKTAATSLAVQPVLSCYMAGQQMHCNGGKVLNIIQTLAGTGYYTPQAYLKASASNGSGVFDYAFNDTTTDTTCGTLLKNCDTTKTDPRCSAPENKLKCNSLVPCEVSNTCSCAYAYESCPSSSIAKYGCSPGVLVSYELVPFSPGPDMGMDTADFKTREKLYEQCLRQYGPFEVSIFASPALKLYKSGIFVDLNIYPQTNHGVVLVGLYDSVIFDSYWILRNSWGDKWGEAGYFKLPRGSDAWGPQGPLCMLRQPPIVFKPA